MSFADLKEHGSENEVKAKGRCSFGKVCSSLLFGLSGLVGSFVSSVHRLCVFVPTFVLLCVCADVCAHVNHSVCKPFRFGQEHTFRPRASI